MRKKMKILKIITNWILGILIIFTVGMAVVSMTSFNKENKKSLFGYNTYIVLSDSMKDTFAAGDMIVTKVVDVETIMVGDIITFRSTSTVSFGKIVSHKVRAINRSTQGKVISFVTYGTTTNDDDESPALASNVFGKYIFKVPKMGYFFEFLQKPIGYITLIFIPISVMLVFQGINSYQLFKKYRFEKKEEANETTDEIKRLREELEALKKDKQ